MELEIIIHPAVPADLNDVKSLLQQNKLPVGDLPVRLEHFFVVKQNGISIGVIGLECYGQYGLLRSMATDKDYRSRGIASELVTELFDYAKHLGLHEMYLLTETAEAFFVRKGFVRIGRDDAPAELNSSSEFSHVCPASAALMRKTI